MPSYVVTGGSRGLGYAFIKALASNPTNIVIGLVRNKTATLARLQKDNITNIHIFEADILDYPVLQAAATAVSKLTDGGLDVLINNAAYISGESRYSSLADAEKDLPAVVRDFNTCIQVNVVGILNTITAFLPLIRAGSVKKIISLSSGLADLDFTLDFAVPTAAPYSISKAALNMLVVKYHNAYKSEGMLFMGISPGLVDTAEGKVCTEEELEGKKKMVSGFKAYAPDFEGPITPEQSAEMVLRVVEEATVEKSGGSFVSHHGNKQWL